jgi:hypothetical protein
VVYDVSDGDPSDGIVCVKCANGEYWDPNESFFGDCVGMYILFPL